MDKRPPILYCHCAHADILPAETRKRVFEALAQSGAAYEAVADLCELAARRDPLLKKFAEGGPVRIIACWPRTVRWLFAYAGATLPAGAVIHNMRKDAAEAILAHITAGEHVTPLRGGYGDPPRDTADYPPRDTADYPPRDAQSAGANPRLGKPAVPQFDAKKPGEWVPWFPVIDYDRCQDCRQCFQFCLFGVYAADEGGKVRVAKPENCKTGCPACARICPQAAIIFPKYAEGAISGDDAPPAADEGRPEKPIDFSSLAGLDIHEAIRRRSAILRARQEREQAKPQDMPVPKACPRKGGAGMPPGQDVPAKKHGHASREGGKRE
jgi:NAD-dependent dihydropyrimidine dehydrogenase PreA subunit